MIDDPVHLHLNLIARMLETAGYAIEVDYTTAVIIVWLDEWPIVLEVKGIPGSAERLLNGVKLTRRG